MFILTTESKGTDQPCSIRSSNYLRKAKKITLNRYFMSPIDLVKDILHETHGSIVAWRSGLFSLMPNRLQNLKGKFLHNHSVHNSILQMTDKIYIDQSMPTPTCLPHVTVLLKSNDKKIAMLYNKRSMSPRDNWKGHCATHCTWMVPGMVNTTQDILANFTCYGLSLAQ